MAVNQNELVFVGKGHQGKVYQIDEGRCIKFYRKRSYRRMEYKALLGAERFPYFPKIYECKGNYMIREFFAGPNLKQYIQQNGFNENLAPQLLGIIEAFAQLGYSRIDTRLGHIIVAGGECLKVIDPTRNIVKRAAYPRKLLTELGQLGFRETFLAYVNTVRPDYYAKWAGMFRSVQNS